MLHISDHRGRDLSFRPSPAWRSCHPDHITAAQNSWVPTEFLRTVRSKLCRNYLSSDSETAPLVQQLGVPDTQGLTSLPGLCSPFLCPQRAGSAWAFRMQSPFCIWEHNALRYLPSAQACKWDSSLLVGYEPRKGRDGIWVSASGYTRGPWPTNGQQ